MSSDEMIYRICAIDIGIDTGFVIADVDFEKQHPKVIQSRTMKIQDIPSIEIPHVGLILVEQPVLNQKVYSGHLQLAAAVTQWLAWTRLTGLSTKMVSASQWKTSAVAAKIQVFPKGITTKHEKDAYRMILYLQHGNWKSVDLPAVPAL